MWNPFRRKSKPDYAGELNRLLLVLAGLSPSDDDYATVLHRVNELDKIINRSSDKFKTVVTAAGPVAAIGAIYGIQQFGGVIVPKAAETYAARQENKKSRELD